MLGRALCSVSTPQPAPHQASRWGRLVGNSRNHLGKLGGGLAYWYEQQIADVMGRLGDKFPRTLDLEGQGLFALGYYQQLAALRPPKKNGKDSNQDGEPA